MPRSRGSTLNEERSLPEQPTTPELETLLSRIESRELVVVVIGLGYVGLPLTLLFCEAGFRVVGFDIDSEKTDRLTRSESYIRQIRAERVASAVASGRIEATSNFDRLAECDAILICVPNPLGPHREPDLQYVRATTEAIAKRLRRGQVVVLESTTYPGTTREEVLPRLESRGLKCGRDFFFAFSPEREDPGNEQFTTKNIPKVVGGVDDLSASAAKALYGAVVDRVIGVSSAEVAEASKLLENIFRAVNIALVNEMKISLDRMGIDIWEVIEAARTKPFGFMPFYPGPGLGGHAFPSTASTSPGRWRSSVCGRASSSSPVRSTTRCSPTMSAKSWRLSIGRSTKGSRILVLGLSYKADVDDDRESPSFEIIELLQARGADVAYCDPFIPVAKRARKHDLGLRSVPCTADEFSRHDILVVSTAHHPFKDPTLYEKVRLVVDTRNVIPRDALPSLVVVRA